MTEALMDAVAKPATARRFNFNAVGLVATIAIMLFRVVALAWREFEPMKTNVLVLVAEIKSVEFAGDAAYIFCSLACSGKWPVNGGSVLE